MNAAPVCLVGCGTAFETIAAEQQAYGKGTGWDIRRAAGIAELSTRTAELLAGIDAAGTELFVAVDGQALNYARLELYGPARLRGLRLTTLVHSNAWVAPGARLADNVWLGPGVRVGLGSRIESDVMVMTGARLDDGVHVGTHAWIGAGSSLGTGVQVGTHSAIGADVQVRAGVKIGRHCSLDHAGPWSRDMADGTLLEPELALAAHIAGPGYSFEKRR